MYGRKCIPLRLSASDSVVFVQLWTRLAWATSEIGYDNEEKGIHRDVQKYYYTVLLNSKKVKCNTKSRQKFPVR